MEEDLYYWGVMRYGWREEDVGGVPGFKVISCSPRFPFHLTRFYEETAFSFIVFLCVM